MAQGYEDIDKLIGNQNQMLDNALTQQQDITNKQTALNIAELEKNKEKLDKETNKTTSGLYTQYQKEVNQYGANADALARQGLGNSGYSETSKTNLYNQYQKNVTDTLSNAQQLKSDFDFQISKARQTGDITLAQNALEIYNHKMQLLTREYELRNNREQFLYQKDQDALAQSNWEKEYAQQQSQWQQTFDYQKQRDAVADSQWQKQYELSKKASSRSSSSSRSTRSRKKSSSSSSGSGLRISESNISDYAKTVASNLQKLKNVPLGQKAINESKNQVAALVEQGRLSVEEAQYIFNNI